MWINPKKGGALPPFIKTYKEVKKEMSQRREIVDKFSRKAGVSKRDANLYLGILLEVIQLILSKKGVIKLPGFGTFRARAIPERKGINPLTGKKMTFSEGVRITFKPGRPLKDKVANGSFIKSNK